MIVLWLEGWGLLLAIFFLFGRWLRLLLFLAIYWLWLLSNGGRIWELLVLNLIISNVLWLLNILQSDDGSDFSNNLLEAEELVHESQLELILLLAKLLVVAESLEKHVALVGPLLSNGLLQEGHDLLKWIVHW